jgi:hypothetical protein
MTTDARALIAEAKRHDEAMSPEMRHSRFSTAPHFRIWAGRNDLTEADVVGLHWLRTNLAALLAGYTAALDEVERLSALVPPSIYNVIETWCSELETSEAQRVRGILNTEIVHQLRTSLAEQALAIEQQDREMERMRAGLREALSMVTLSPDLEEQNDRLHELAESKETHD